MCVRASDKSERECKSTSRFSLINETVLNIKGIIGRPALKILIIKHFPLANVPVQKINFTFSEQLTVFKDL